MTRAQEFWVELCVLQQKRECEVVELGDSRNRLPDSLELASLLQ